MVKRALSAAAVLLVGGACPGPSGMDVKGTAIVPGSAIAAAVTGKRYALFGSYQNDGGKKPRVSETATVLCSASLPAEIPFWVGFFEGCGAPGVIALAIHEIAPTKEDPCLSTVEGVRPDLKPLRGIMPVGAPLATATRRVFENERAECAEHADDRREDVGTLALVR
jgi:hypothetical protein